MKFPHGSKIIRGEKGSEGYWKKPIPIQRMGSDLLVSRMKVLFLYRHGILGGVCTQLFHRLRHLDPNGGMEIHCGFRSDNGVESMLGKYASLHFGLVESNTHKFVEEQDFDLIVIIDSEEYVSSLRQMENRPPVVIEVHTSIERNLEYLGRLNEGDLDSFITVSEYMKRRIEFHRDESTSETQILIFDNVIDTDLFVNSEETDGGAPVLLWIGKIDDHKDWRAFMEICGNVCKKLPHVEYWIVGGQTCNQSLSQKVFEEADKRGIIGRFRWLDRIENEKIPRLISLVANRGGAKIVTSHGESFGMSILEALLCRCPVISSSVGAIPEIARVGDGFQLYDLGDLDRATDLAVGFLRGDESANRRGVFLDEISNFLHNRYSSSIRSKDYWKILQDIAN